jgi:hypothetical protein
MADAHKNFAYSLVATAPSPATTGTSLIVTAAQGALFPAVPFNLTVWPALSQPFSTNAEIVTVTAIATDTFTIVRQAEGTSARTIIIGDQVAATITQRTLNDGEGELAPSTDKGIQSGFSVYFPESYEIADTKMMDIGDTAILEVG